MSFSDEVYIPTAWLQATVDTLERKQDRAQELMEDVRFRDVQRHEHYLQYLWLDQRIKVLKTQALLSDE